MRDAEADCSADAVPSQAPPDGDLVDFAREFLAREAPALAQVLLADWPDSRARRAVAPHPLPVTRWLAAAAREAPAPARRLLGRLTALADSLAWRQTYTASELGAAFMHNYGWTEFVGPRGLAPSDRLACGILVLGPHTEYPWHRHEAYEVYVPVAGTAEWQQGDRAWQLQAPATAIEHASDVPHAMRTTVEPLVALYLWRSHDLTQSARLEAR